MNNVNTPIAVKRKAKVLAELFPNKLPSNFAEAMDPSKYGGLAGSVMLKANPKYLSCVTVHTG